MKSELGQKLVRFLFSLICFVAYLFLFVGVLADALNTNLHHVILGCAATGTPI